MTYRRTMKLTTALAAAAALAACSGGSGEPLPANDSVNAMELPEELPVENMVEPEPTPTPSATPAPVAEAALPDAEQIQDDAESVGMTARVQRGDSTDNQTAPAE